MSDYDQLINFQMYEYTYTNRANLPSHHLKPNDENLDSSSDIKDGQVRPTYCGPERGVSEYNQRFDSYVGRARSSHIGTQVSGIREKFRFFKVSDS